jgi:hypothetical protein
MIGLTDTTVPLRASPWIWLCFVAATILALLAQAAHNHLCSVINDSRVQLARDKTTAAILKAALAVDDAIIIDQRPVHLGYKLSLSHPGHFNHYRSEASHCTNYLKGDQFMNATRDITAAIDDLERIDLGEPVDLPVCEVRPRHVLMLREKHSNSEKAEQAARELLEAEISKCASMWLALE